MKITRTNRNTFKLIQTICLNIIYSKNTNSLSSLITFFPIGKLISFEYIIEIRGERPTHLAPSSRYQSAVCGIGFCPFFFFFFSFFPASKLDFAPCKPAPCPSQGRENFSFYAGILLVTKAVWTWLYGKGYPNVLNFWHIPLLFKNNRVWRSWNWKFFLVKRFSFFSVL